MPENYSSCVNGNMIIHLAKFSANRLHLMFSREKAQTRSRTTHRFCHVDIMQLPALMSSPVSSQWTLKKKSYKAIQSLRSWSQNILNSALSQLGSNEKGCSPRYLWIPGLELYPQGKGGWLVQDHASYWLVASLFMPGKHDRIHLRWKTTLLMVIFLLPW